jgi:hypothetical protein
VVQKFVESKQSTFAHSRCNASEEVTVLGRHRYLHVRCNRPVLNIAGTRLCGGRITERLAPRAIPDVLAAQPGTKHGATTYLGTFFVPVLRTLRPCSVNELVFARRSWRGIDGDSARAAARNHVLAISRKASRSSLELAAAARDMHWLRQEYSEMRIPTVLSNTPEPTVEFRELKEGNPVRHRMSPKMRERVAGRPALARRSFIRSPMTLAHLLPRGHFWFGGTMRGNEARCPGNHHSQQKAL